MLEGTLGDEFNDIEEDANAEWRREESDKKKDTKKARKADSGKKSPGSSKKVSKSSGKLTTVILHHPLRVKNWGFFRFIFFRRHVFDRDYT